jgi:hypothetical protein
MWLSSKTEVSLSEPTLDDLLFAIASHESVSLNDILRVSPDINAVGERISRTVLMAAAYAGNCELIKTLAANGT